MQRARPRRPIMFAAIVTALVLLLAACGEDDLGSKPDPATPTPQPTPTPTTAPEAHPLLDTDWELAEIDGAAATDETRVSLEFTDQAGGYAGCNWYGGAYEASGDRLRFSEMASTMRLCAPESIMQQEMRYLELLGEVASFEMGDNRLTLRSDAGDTLLVFTQREVADVDPGDLYDTTWELVAVDGVAHIGAPALLTFHADGTFTTRDGCYNASGEYVTDGDRLSFPASNANAHACLQPLAWQTHEASMSQALGDIAYYRFADGGDTLELLHHDGRVSTFARAESMPEDDAWSVTWTLKAIHSGGAVEEPIPGTTITLVFPNPSLQLDEPVTVTGNSGCNMYQGTATAGVERFTFSDIIVTEMACMEPSGVMDQETRYLELLASVTSLNNYEFDAPLRLTTDDGDVLEFVVAE